MHIGGCGLYCLRVSMGHGFLLSQRGIFGWYRNCPFIGNYYRTYIGIINYRNYKGGLKNVIINFSFFWFFSNFGCGLIWLFANEGIREQLKEIQQLEQRTKEGFIYQGKDFAQQEWRTQANQRDLPKYRNNPYFAGDVIRHIERRIQKDLKNWLLKGVRLWGVTPSQSHLLLFPKIICWQFCLNLTCNQKAD